MTTQDDDMHIGIDPAAVQAEFDRLAAYDDAGWDHNNHYHGYLLRHLQEPCDNALEIGCGTGAFSRQLVDHAAHVQAIDLSSEMIRLARERSAAYSTIDFVQDDFMQMALPPESFDCIATIATLHHLPLDDAFIKMRNLLRPGGLLLVLDLYQNYGVKDMLLELLAVPVSRVLRRIKRGGLVSSSGSDSAWAAHEPYDHYPTLAKVDQLCKVHLSGAVVRQHLLWRYSVVWRKP